MSLRTIGAGFGRTGTLSLKLALEQLGFDPCHHMVEVLKHPELLARWQRVARGEPVDWDAVFRGYRSTVDWPAAAYWQSLAEHYPAAKVILTIRDPDDWYASFQQTILPTRQSIGGTDDAHVRAAIEMGEAVLRTCVFGGAPPTRDWSVRRFRSNERMVRRVIAPERLLVLDISEGWDPLCEFLGVPVPAGPFPCVNTRQEFGSVLST